MNYPTLEQVNAADRTEICRWWRFLPIARSEAELDVVDRIAVRFKEYGGFTPEISKEVGLEL